MALYADFNAWLGALPHPHKFVIGGNHDRYLDATQPGALSVAEVRALLSNATYLLNEDAYVPLPLPLQVPCVVRDVVTATIPVVPLADDVISKSQTPSSATPTLTHPVDAALTDHAVAPPPPRRSLRIFGTPFSYGNSKRRAFQGRLYINNPKPKNAGDVTACPLSDDGTPAADAVGVSVASTEAMLLAQLCGAPEAAGSAVPDPSSPSSLVAAATGTPTEAPAIDVLITHHSVHAKQMPGNALTRAILGPRPVARVHVGGHYHAYYGARVHSTQRGATTAPSAAPVVAVNASVLDDDYALVRGAVVFDMC
jgi:hypothetical protein